MLALAEEERAYKTDMAEMYGNATEVIRSKRNGQGYEEEGRGNNVSTENICSSGQRTAESPRTVRSPRAGKSPRSQQ